MVIKFCKIEATYPTFIFAWLLFHILRSSGVTMSYEHMLYCDFWASSSLAFSYLLVSILLNWNFQFHTVYTEWSNRNIGDTNCKYMVADSLRYTSALSVALAVVFLVITIGISIVKLISGGVMMPRLLPDITNWSSFFQLFTSVPVLVTAYICHYNGMHIVYLLSFYV